MSTIDELYAQGFTAMRLPQWSIPTDHIRVTEAGEGRLGPWVYLHSVLAEKPTAISISEVDQMTDWVGVQESALFSVREQS